jgi:hypothetical protein
VGYHTEFEGRVYITPPLNPQEIAYLTEFSETRRMKREMGPYFIGGTGYAGQGRDKDIEDYNSPPSGQPGLWCGWEPTEDGTAIKWNRREKFYSSTEWMRYLIDHFLKPSGLAKETPGFEGFTFDHTVAGVIHAEGEEEEDIWDLVVWNNHVWGQDDPRPTDEILDLATTVRLGEFSQSASGTVKAKELEPSAEPRQEQSGQMVSFPAETECLRDSGEGGLFVVMVVPEPEEGVNHNCSVDVQILMTRADVCVSSRERDFWAHNSRESWNSKTELDQHIAKTGNIDWKRWMFHAYSGTDLSFPMQAAVHLGSTGMSLYDEHKGSYWNATKEDLTPAGKALYEALKAAYGVAPVLLTFLDT